MGEDLRERIIDPNLDTDPTKYTVVFFGRFDTPKLLREKFEQEAILSIVVDKNTHEIFIGDTHSNMRDGSRSDPENYSIIYSRYDKESGKIIVEDYHDFRPGDKTSKELKDMIAAKLQVVIYGNQ